MTESKNNFRCQICHRKNFLNEGAEKLIIKTILICEREEAISFINKCVEELCKPAPSLELCKDFLNVALCRLEENRWVE